MHSLQTSPSQYVYCVQESVTDTSGFLQIRLQDIHILGSPEATEAGNPLPGLCMSGTSAPPGTSQVCVLPCLPAAAYHYS